MPSPNNVRSGIRVMIGKLSCANTGLAVSAYLYQVRKDIEAGM
jgi:hypothetical protein